MLFLCTNIARSMSTIIVSGMSSPSSDSRPSSMLVQVFSVSASVRRFMSTGNALVRKAVMTTLVVRVSPVIGPSWRSIAPFGMQLTMPIMDDYSSGGADDARDSVYVGKRWGDSVGESGGKSYYSGRCYAGVSYEAGA